MRPENISTIFNHLKYKEIETLYNKSNEDDQQLLNDMINKCIKQIELGNEKLRSKISNDTGIIHIYLEKLWMILPEANKNELAKLFDCLGDCKVYDEIE